MSRRWLYFLEDESGAELVEYAVVLALFSIVSIVAIQALSVTANNSVEHDETGFGDAFVNGY